MDTQNAFLTTLLKSIQMKLEKFLPRYRGIGKKQFFFKANIFLRQSEPLDAKKTKMRYALKVYGTKFQKFFCWTWKKENWFFPKNNFPKKILWTAKKQFWQRLPKTFDKAGTASLSVQKSLKNFLKQEASSNCSHGHIECNCDLLVKVFCRRTQKYCSFSQKVLKSISSIKFFPKNFLWTHIIKLWGPRLNYFEKKP